MSALRILHVVPYYEDAWAYGGIPRLATAMTHSLAARGHTVTVCTTDVCDHRSRVPRERGQMRASGVDVHVFRNLSNRLAYHLQFFTPVGLAHYMREGAQQFDIAHLHACRNLPATIAARALQRARVPYVSSPNGTAPAIERRLAAKRLFEATLGRHELTGAALVVAASEAERQQLQQLGVPGACLRVVPNPVVEEEFAIPRDPGGFRQTHALGNGEIVLFLRHLTPRKGVHILLRAVHHHGRSGATLVVAGNDMGAGRGVDALTAALGLEGRTRRLGLLRGRERLDALAAADVVVYPSQAEVFGLVAVEALLCGSPVIACDDSGCGEIVSGAGGGLCVPYGDPARLARAITTILDARDEWRSKAGRAAPLLLDRFASSSVCERLEGLYFEVLSSRGAVA